MTGRVMTRQDRADAQYQERLERCVLLALRIRAALDAHRDRQALEPWNWVWGVELGACEARLLEALRTVGDAEAAERENGGK